MSAPLAMLIESDVLIMSDIMMTYGGDVVVCADMQICQRVVHERRKTEFTHLRSTKQIHYIYARIDAAAVDCYTSAHT